MESRFEVFEEALARLKADALASEQAGQQCAERRIGELKAEFAEERAHFITIRKSLEDQIQKANLTQAQLLQEHEEHEGKVDALSEEAAQARSDLDEAKETTRVQEDARRRSADDLRTTNAEKLRLHALCNKQARANQELVQELSDFKKGNPDTFKAHAEEIAALKAAKAEAEAKQAAAEQAFLTLKADLVGRELLVAKEQQQAQANQPLKASKKKKKQKVATSEGAVKIVEETNPMEESVCVSNLMEKGVQNTDDVRLLKQEVKQLKAALEAANISADQCNARYDAEVTTAAKKHAKLQKRFEALTGKVDYANLRDNEASAMEAEKKSKEQEEALDEAVKLAAGYAEQLARLQVQVLQLDQDRKDALQWQATRAPQLHETARNALKAEDKAVARIAQLEREKAALRESQPVNLVPTGSMPGSLLVPSLPRSGDPSSPSVGSPGTPGVPPPPTVTTYSGMVTGPSGKSGLSSGGVNAVKQPPPGTVTDLAAGGSTGQGAQQGGGRILVLPRGPPPSQAVAARRVASHMGPGGSAARGSVRHGGPQGGGRVLELPRGAPVRQARVLEGESVPHPHNRGANNRRGGTPAQGRRHGGRQSGRHPTASANTSSR